MIGCCGLTSLIKVNSQAESNGVKSTDGGRTDELTCHKTLRRRIVRPHQGSTDGGIGPPDTVYKTSLHLDLKSEQKHHTFQFNRVKGYSYEIINHVILDFAQGNIPRDTAMDSR
jgi:hypothetical protein